MKPYQINVLVACEESQTVCKAFRSRGFNAYSCDLQPCSGGHPEWHIQDNILSVLDRGIFIPDLLIAHPPCTYLTKASACRMYPKAGVLDRSRYYKALDARSFFLDLLTADYIPFIAIENPTPLKIVDLPRHTQVIQPYQFGHPFSKRTLLWLKNLPPLAPTCELSEYVPFIASNCSKNKGTDYNRGKAAGSVQRSKTFGGVAEAMAEQWGNYILDFYNGDLCSK